MSRMPEAVDAVIGAIGLATALPVRDGPVLTADPGDAIYIGYNGNPEDEGEAGTSQQEWAGLGAKKRDENLTITGAVVCSNGDGDAKVARDAAYAQLALIEGAIHPSPSLGMSAPTWMGVTSHRLVYVLDEQVGLQAWLPFVISVRTRL
jgi:hypothetical protein